ncbi:hypothetical protein FS837_011405 [Tulasnella sp. UAMH 9824]|nr:hypothetical protein FS837_011405 [Tulasnella sp. UAMH 9824]
MFSLRYPTGSFTEHRLKDYWGSLVPTNPYVGLDRIDLKYALSKRLLFSLGADNVALGIRLASGLANPDSLKQGKHHCQLELKITEEGAYHVTLRDLDSTNGTFLNGVRLARGQSARIYDGDIFSLAERIQDAFIQEDDISFTFSTLLDTTEGE